MLGDPIVFTASIGQGHNQAARAIKEELESQGFSHIEVIDTLHWLHPLLHHSVQMSYKIILRYLPSVWKRIFYESSQTGKVLRSYEKTIRFFSKRVEHFIEDRQPPFIISTHPSATWLVALAIEKKNWNIPLYSVVTDFRLHPAYIHKHVTSYFTIDEAANQFALLHGLNPSIFHQTGIPFPEKHPSVLDSDLFRRQQHIPLDRFVILVTGGGLGIASYQDILEELERLSVPLTILLMTGHNRYAKRKMNHLKSKHDFRILSFTKQFLSYLAISDVLITKAGGLTLSEALVCEVPVVLYEPLPGHEEQNATIAVRWGVALRAFERNQLSKQVELILTNERLRKQMILSARQHKTPNAAREIVQEITLRQSLLSEDVARVILEPKGIG